MQLSYLFSLEYALCLLQYSWYCIAARTRSLRRTYPSNSTTANTNPLKHHTIFSLKLTKGPANSTSSFDTRAAPLSHSLLSLHLFIMRHFRSLLKPATRSWLAGAAVVPAALLLQQQTQCKEATAGSVIPAERFLYAPLSEDKTPRDSVEFDTSAPMRKRMEAMILRVQEDIVAGIEAVDGKKFRTDHWEREGHGGGGRSMILQVCVCLCFCSNVSVCVGTDARCLLRLRPGRQCV